MGRRCPLCLVGWQPVSCRDLLVTTDDWLSCVPLVLLGLELWYVHPADQQILRVYKKKMLTNIVS